MSKRDCIMEMYAAFHGAWDDYHESYTWQSLGDAAAQTGVVVEGTPHRALADARAALGVLKHMAGSE